MKRSTINRLMEEAEDFFEEMRFRLPPWAFWEPERWKGMKSDSGEIVHNMLGWDITDFGSGDFPARGLLLFTLRNGNPGRDDKPYAEKIMIVREGQETPYHFHWNKMEDIINRGGGNLVLELYNATPEGGLADTEVNVGIDGIRRSFDAGAQVLLTPGESICLTRGLYHRFYAEGATVLTGEVSVVNDDTSDNRFFEELPRFPGIEEDVHPRHLLAFEYEAWL